MCLTSLRGQTGIALLLALFFSVSCASRQQAEMEASAPTVAPPPADYSQESSIYGGTDSSGALPDNVEVPTIDDSGLSEAALAAATNGARPSPGQSVAASSSPYAGTDGSVPSRVQASSAANDRFSRDVYANAAAGNNPALQQTTPSPVPSTRQTARVAPGFVPRQGEQLIEHRVRIGETIYDLAATYNTSVSRIRAANGLSTARASIGDVLQIPTSAPPPGLGSASGAAGGLSSTTSYPPLPQSPTGGFSEAPARSTEARAIAPSYSSSQSPYTGTTAHSPSSGSYASGRYQSTQSAQQGYYSNEGVESLY